VVAEVVERLELVGLIVLLFLKQPLVAVVVDQITVLTLWEPAAVLVVVVPLAVLVVVLAQQVKVRLVALVGPVLHNLLRAVAVALGQREQWALQLVVGLVARD
jgi:hypothetical protein